MVAKDGTSLKIEDRKDRIAAQIIKCLEGFTFQEAMDQLDFTKEFIMNRIVMKNIDFTTLSGK